MTELMVLAWATALIKRQKQKEERKKVLRICVNKLQKIQDPESFLCKSVLINNTLKNIQLEHREAQREATFKRERDNEESLNTEEPEAKKKCFVVQLEEEADEIIVDHESNPLSSSYYDVNSYKTDTLDDVIISDSKDQISVTSHIVVNHKNSERDRNFWPGENLDFRSTLDISVISSDSGLTNIDAVVPIHDNDSFDDTLSESSGDEATTSDSSCDDTGSSECDTDLVKKNYKFEELPVDQKWKVSMIQEIVNIKHNVLVLSNGDQVQHDESVNQLTVDEMNEILSYLATS